MRFESKACDEDAVMKVLSRLIDRYGEHYSNAFINIIYVTISLFAAAVLFGPLRSTGFIKLVLPGVPEAEFVGAAAIFVITFFILHRLPIIGTKAKSELKGNVVFADGKPVKGASVSVDGIDRHRETDDTGLFTIEVNEQNSWVVRASYENRTVYETVKRGDHQKPVLLSLKPPEPKYKKTGDKQIDGVLEELNQLCYQHGKDTSTDDLFPHFSQLFRRAAFKDEVDRTSPDGLKGLLYAVTITELILRDYGPVVQSRMPPLSESYNKLRDELLKLRKQIAKIFGEEFDIATHVEKYGMYKTAFLQNLPYPDNPLDFNWKDADSNRKIVMKQAEKLFHGR